MFFLWFLTIVLKIYLAISRNSTNSSRMGRLRKGLLQNAPARKYQEYSFQLDEILNYLGFVKNSERIKKGERD